ncbi:hydroxyacylglutathione hydrolase [Ochrobactrum sp. WV_118_8]|uniref:Hydroxyacylglutathione hydrolase n=1 Tax=Brucella anthropi TaxID=529 RepID=A0A6L3Z4T2_BRUAN|nr:hydroxyacylglutathione hydrolase [Brucella anthropi]KAB2767973.1 hydroxyacylglutathione hydrolase [Brucella anthropi]UVV67381.1 hydroxyacylglutathione hydrolase [Brucella anthropi]
MNGIAARLEIEQFICRSDNYGALIHDPQSALTASIDAPDAAAIEAALKRRGWTLDFIFTTHHHLDHVEGNDALKAKYGVSIIGPKAEETKIPGIDRTVKDGDEFTFGLFRVKTIATPGHTAGEVSYYLPDAKAVFTGDTLFALGCGRLFEGTPLTMFQSLQKLVALPGDTAVYCGHEYTESNARFALTIDPANSALKERAAEIARLRAADRMTLPSSIALEMATNPFLRWHDAGIRSRLGLQDAPDEAVFAEIRKRKDMF